MDALLSRLIAEDTARLAEVHRIDWSSLHGGSLLMTGCTGPFGWWLLHKLSHACEYEGLRLERITLLTRSANRVKPWVEYLHPALGIQVCQSDILNADQLGLEATHVVHGATTSAAETNAGATEIEKFETVVDGTRALIRGLERCPPKKMLYLSSGIAYGNGTGVRMLENSGLGPETTEISASLGHAKRAAEFLMACAAHRWDAQLSIARCFSFSGVGMPLDLHYAIGNFVLQAAGGGPIVITGNSKKIRSYMHLGDLAIWLATMLTTAPEKCSTIYNVGSDQPLSVLELAEIVASLPGQPCQIEIVAQPTENLSGNHSFNYLPSIRKARASLGLATWTPLRDSVRDMITWASKKASSSAASI